MELADPILRVGKIELAHPRRFEIDGLAPICGELSGEILIGELFQVVAIGSEMVVNDIENGSDAEGVCLVDKAAKIVRSAVKPGRCEQVDAVVAPTPSAREVSDRHDLEGRDAGRGEIPQTFTRTVPGPL